ncbi:MAG: hypothetical protein HYX53_02950 [Chloroflexi bacterium]|nr:hypothetical protein [Chloroflexota bacterium]
MAERKLEIVFLGNAKPAQDAMQQLAQSGEGLQAKIGGLEGAFSKVTTVAGGFLLGNAITKGPSALLGLSDTARDLELQMKKASVVFNDQLPVVQQWAAGNASAMGLTKSQAVNLAAGLQDLLVPMGMNRDEAAALSTKTIGLAGALAEWSGGSKSAAEVAEILTSAYLGETDGLKALGISISAAEVEARLPGEGATGPHRDRTAAERGARHPGDDLREEHGRAEGVCRGRRLGRAQAGGDEGAHLGGERSARPRPRAGLRGRRHRPRDRRHPGAIPALTAFSQHVGPALASAIEASRPVLEGLGTAIGVVGGWMRDTLVPAVQAFIATDIVPKLQAAKEIFDAIAPAVADLAVAVGERLKPPLMAVLEFVGAHKEILAGVAVVIGGALVAAFVSWAVSATAAAVATVAALAPVIAIGLALALLAAGIIWLVKNWDDLEKKYPALKTATDAVKAAFEAFAGWITGTYVPAVTSIATAITEAVTTAIGFVRDHWHEIEDVIRPVVEAAKLVVQTAWDQMRLQIETVLGVIKGVVDVFMGVFTGDWDRAWAGVKGIFGAVWTGLEGTARNAITLLAGLAPLMLDAAKGLGAALKDGIVSGIKGIAENVGDIAQALIDAFREAVNRALRWLNDNVRIEVPGFDPPGPGSIPGFSWGFPLIQLARGVRDFRGGLALVGEEGPELVHLPRGADVLPADQTRQVLSRVPGRNEVTVTAGDVVIYARDPDQGRQSLNDFAYGLAAALRARGVA